MDRGGNTRALIFAVALAGLATGAGCGHATEDEGDAAIAADDGAITSRLRGARIGAAAPVVTTPNASVVTTGPGGAGGGATSAGGQSGAGGEITTAGTGGVAPGESGGPGGMNDEGTAGAAGAASGGGGMAGAGAGAGDASTGGTPAGGGGSGAGDDGAAGEAGAAGSGGVGGDTPPVPLVDVITLGEAAELEPRRRALRQVIWGQPELPASQATIVKTTRNCRTSSLSGVDHVAELRLPMEENEEGLACQYVPVKTNDRLVIYNPGHFCTFLDGSSWDTDGWAGYGDQRAVQALLDEGYSVLVTYMPYFRPDDCWSYSYADPHLWMFENLHPAAGSVWKYFLEPIVASLNTLNAQADANGTAAYAQIDMLGLSGGGWTTVAMAAIDPRIKLSIQVAGSEPLDFWGGWSSNDEQTLPDLYRVAGYRDLYLLGATGEGRRQVQILNRHDDCCFSPAWSELTSDAWEQSLRATAREIDERLSVLGYPGTYRLEIDDLAAMHQISRTALSDVILPELAAHAPAPTL